jgi:hypothetical protein
MGEQKTSNRMIPLSSGMQYRFELKSEMGGDKQRLKPPARTSVGCEPQLALLRLAFLTNLKSTYVPCNQPSTTSPPFLVFNGSHDLGHSARGSCLAVNVVGFRYRGTIL